MFLLFVNDIPASVNCTAKLFADDTKLYTEITNRTDCHNLQSDLNKLSAWSKMWEMKFNASKCVVLQIHKKQDYVYTMNKTEIKSVTDQKDLGIIVSHDLQPRKHIESICSKANQKGGLFKRCFINKSAECVTNLYASIIRPNLEYASVVWSPWLKKDIELLEKAQKRVLKLSRESICMESLEARRNRTALIEAYKYINGQYKNEIPELFVPNEAPTRGHSKKLFVPRVRLELMKHFFPVEVIKDWNSLPEEVISAPSVASFKRRLIALEGRHQ